MDQFNFIFNPTCLYETLFFTVVTTTKYPNLETLEKEDSHMYYHWMNISEKKFNDSSNEIYLTKGQYIDEFAQISSIGYGGFYLDNNKIIPYYKYIDGDEKEIVKKFFSVLESFRNKKLDGILCGHNINGHHIPILCKTGLKYNLDIPKSFKNNLTAKPWENSILDTVDLWKFTGGSYSSLELISDYLGIQTERIDFNRINIKYHTDSEFSIEKITKIRYEQLVKLYSKLRNM